MQTDDLISCYLLANAAVNREGVSVTLCGPGPELNKIGFGLAAERLRYNFDQGIARSA